MKKRLLWLIPAAVLALLAAFLIYALDYYHADGTALDALASDERVRVTRTDYGWHFDGPSGAYALAFYPGAKVDEAAYAPLLHRLAREGMDACLLRVPFRLAFFGANAASKAMAAHDYAHWYVGGHSLGGVVAANYAAAHPDRAEGVVMLAAYPQKPLEGDMTAISLLGSEDGVLNPNNYKKGWASVPKRFIEHCIQGGNHAQFGNYGPQSGDGRPSISAGDQQAEAVKAILEGIAGEAAGAISPQNGITQK